MTVKDIDVVNERTGSVFIDDFDRGVIETLGAVVSTSPWSKVPGDIYAVTIDGVSPPPEFPGVPVYFAFPEETFDNKILPSIIVRRDSISPAMSRWHLGALEYRIPAPGAHPVTIRHRITGAILATGYDSYEQKDQAVPYDLLYTIQIRAPFRNNLRAAAMRMLKHSMRHYQPYTRVMIVDDLGDQRGYDAFMETPSGVDTKTDVANRETNFNLTLRVEGELDLNDPVKMRAMTSLPLIRYSIK